MITPEMLRTLFRYDAETGKLIWLRRDDVSRTGKTWNTRFAGMEVGAKCPRGYLRAKVDGKLYLVHRLIWVMVYGECPEQVDHINGNPSDNRLCNLRSVSGTENARNVRRKSTNKSGVNGVWYNKRWGKFEAYIGDDGKRKHLGGFDTLDEAVRVRKLAEIEYGYHENHGRDQVW